MKFKPLSPREMYAAYKAQTQRLLPLLQYEKSVSSNQQQHEIDLLKDTLRFDRFFFVINLHQFRIEHAHGIEKWLGYPDKQFTLLNFLEAIHPAHIETHHITATELLEGLMSGKWDIEFMKHRFASNVALRNKKGEYLLFKRLGCVFQYSKDHQLLEYINEFTFVEDFTNTQAYTFRAINEDGTRCQWLEDVLVKVKLSFKNKSFFTFQQLRILRKLAYQPHLLAENVATALKIKRSTVIKHTQEILIRAEMIFHKKFDTAKQVAAALKEQGLV